MINHVSPRERSTLFDWLLRLGESAADACDILHDPRRLSEWLLTHREEIIRGAALSACDPPRVH